MPVIFWSLASGGIFLPATLSVLIAFTPDTLIANADAGKLVASNGATAASFFAAGATTVQTSMG